jgi:hypothetical protein
VLWEQEAPGSNPGIPTISAVQGLVFGWRDGSQDRLTVNLNTDWRYWSARIGSCQPAGRACGRFALNTIEVRSGQV